MGTFTWTVKAVHSTGSVLSEQVAADGWTITPNGDLVLYNAGETNHRGMIEAQFPIRGFAEGTWREVSLYA